MLVTVRERNIAKAEQEIVFGLSNSAPLP